MKTLQRISVLLVLIVGACALEEDTARSSEAVTRLGGQTQSACTVRTPTSWLANGKWCSTSWAHTYQLEIGDYLELTTIWYGDHQTLYCSETGLVVIEEVCEFGD